MLEASFILFRVQPLHANVRKRLIKSPKLYFHDVGLAAALLGIDDRAQLATHPLRGALFENLVMSEALKHRTHRGLRENLAFYRESTGREIDLVVTVGNRLLVAEIKSGATLNRRWLAALTRGGHALPTPPTKHLLVFNGDSDYETDGVQVTVPREVSRHLGSFDRE